ncbi:hypothetical protein AnigIFM56816_001270 [Aspergillus niger]|nr:hypothetical protein AnigIFM56816_001270 [Aspergillus niger]
MVDIVLLIVELAVGLLANRATAVAVDEAFTISSDGSGLRTAFDQAFTASEDTEDTTVATKLFAAWLGVFYDFDQAQFSNDNSHISFQVFLENFQIYEDFVSSGEYTTNISPPRLFCDNFGDFFDWNDPALDASGQGVELDGVALTIADMYADVYASEDANGRTPYYISSMGTYAFPLTSNLKTDELCSADADGNLLMGVSIPGQAAGTPKPSNTRQCPICLTVRAAFDSTIPWEYDVLADLPTNEPGDGDFLYSVMPRNSTFFHELWHLVTFWKTYSNEQTGDTTLDRMTDLAYPVQDCLTLAQGRLEKQEAHITNDGQTTYESWRSAYNVESNVYLALSWWYWETYGAAFFDGYPRDYDWNGDN